jgi:hypothetical protein
MYDKDAWDIYPNHRNLFNKLELSLRLGYLCGPAGIDVPKRGMYCIRPIYNLNGMGAGSYIQELLERSDNYIPPGYFWCELFKGTHYSIDWEYNNEWKPIFCCIGERNEDDPLYKFIRWKIVDVPNSIVLPDFIKNIKNVKNINTEYIGNNLIEIHLRKNQDFPDGASELLPIWSIEEKEKFQHLLKDGWNFKSDVDNSNGNLPETRIGFYYR